MHMPELDPVCPLRKLPFEQRQMLILFHRNDMARDGQIDFSKSNRIAKVFLMRNSQLDEGFHGILRNWTDIARTKLKRQRARYRLPVKLILDGQMIEQQFSEATAIIISCAKEQNSFRFHGSRVFSS